MLWCIVVFGLSLIGPYGLGWSGWSNTNWQDEATILTLAEVNKRVELHSLRYGAPTADQGLKAVYGDKEVSKDAWGNEFVYVPPAGEGLPFDLISYGADGKPGGKGMDADIRWGENR